jgi:glycosyltransferase involved in cell wall biosynthesis
MRFLFVHQNFPAQFKHLAPFLASIGHDVSALTMRVFPHSEWQGVKIHTYNLTRTNTPDGHPWILEFESKVLRGEACLTACLKLKNAGYQPDVIIAHPGWGESLFLHQVWEAAKLKLYYEWFYHSTEYDVGFDPEFSHVTPYNSARVELKNSNILLSSEPAFSGISPTTWQKNTFPSHIQSKITVIHDGIDTRHAISDPRATLRLESGLQLRPGDEVVTFVSRTLEPYRGFHIFMRSLPEILSKRANSVVLIVGGDRGGYGAGPIDEQSWRVRFEDEIHSKLTNDQKRRVIFLGKLPYQTFLTVLQVSSVHIYLTYPFVLSWSLLEAMSIGCRIIGSNTPPVAEVMTNCETGFLVNFFDEKALAELCIKLLRDKNYGKDQKENARQHIIENYDLTRICLPRQANWALAL